MLKIKVVGSLLSKQAFIEDKPNIKADCNSTYSAIGKLVYLNQELFGVKIELKFN